MSGFSTESGGYLDDIFCTPITDSLKCGICLMVLRDPIRVCENDHCFCRSCFCRINNNKCPECRNTTASSVPARLLNGVILELPVKCCAGGKSECEWRGMLQGLEAHLSQCGFMESVCSSIGCDARMQKRYLNAHEAICPYRLISCDLCCASVKSISLTAHKLACINRCSLCENGCGLMIPQSQISEHRLQCLLEIVECPYKDLMDCSHRCARRDMVSHFSDVSYHFMGMAAALLELKQSHNELLQSQIDLKRKNYELEQLVRESKLVLDTTTLTLLDEIEQRRHDRNAVQEFRKRIDDVNLSWQINLGRFEFCWEINDFNIESSLLSPTFQAFGHTLYLNIYKQDDDSQNSGYHGLYLHMESRSPDKLGFKFYLGRRGREGNDQYSIIYKSSGFRCYSAENDSWSYGKAKMAPTSDLTRERLLNTDGSLFISVTVYKGAAQST